MPHATSVRLTISVSTPAIKYPITIIRLLHPHCDWLGGHFAKQEAPETSFTGFMDALHPLPNKANHGLYYKSRNFEYYFQIIIDKKICISKYCLLSEARGGGALEKFGHI